MSVRGGVHFDLVKRVLRDINRSGQAPEEIIQQISDTVYPMYKVRIIVSSVGKGASGPSTQLLVS